MIVHMKQNSNIHSSQILIQISNDKKKNLPTPRSKCFIIEFDGFLFHIFYFKIFYKKLSVCETKMKGKNFFFKSNFNKNFI